MNRWVLEEEKHVDNTHLKGYATFLEIEKIQYEAVLRYTFFVHEV